MSKTIVPNRIESKEIQKLIADNPNLDIPTAIKEYNKDFYNLLAVATEVNNKTGAVIKRLKVFTKSKDIWLRLSNYDKQPKVLANCQELYILHDPTLRVKKSGKFEPYIGTGRLTDTKKEKINTLMSEGKGENDNALNDIAESLNVSFSKIKEYIQSF